ncbi:hypothetical protein RhoFasSB10_04294 [Rhodococcus fascians]|uniref:APC family permease n=1 Tax=Rhodococcoides fascians TaxID=1828 RepID=UPI0016B892E0|nr:hypothetical protein [Rhodococcus fascians]
MGVWGIVFIVAAFAGPLGAMGGTVPIGINAGNGIGLPTTFVVSTIILLLFSVAYTALTPYVRNAGAFYAYIGTGLGRRTGFGTAFMALLAYLALLVGVYGLLGSGITALLASWGVDAPWWVGAYVSMVAATFLGFRNIDLSKRVLGALLIAEVGIVLALDAAVVVSGGTDEGMSSGFSTPDALLSGAPGLALLFCFLSFLGFEATAVFRDECRNPNRTIPIATYLAVTLVGLLYVVSTWALISAWGDTEAISLAATDPGSMLPGAVGTYLGSTAEHIVQVLYVTSLFACLLSIQNVTSRYVFNISQRGALPAVLGMRNERHGSPSTASNVVTAIAAVFVLLAIVINLDPATELYAWFAGATTVGFILMLLGTTVSALIFFARRRRAGQLEESVVRVIVAPAIALICLVAVFVLVLQNLRELVGGSLPVAWAVLGLLTAAFAYGFVVATRKPGLSLDN